MNTAIFIAETFKYYSGSLAHSSVNIREVWAIVRECFPKFEIFFRNNPSFFRKHSGSLRHISGSLRLILGTKTASNHYKNGFFIFINISIRFLFRE
jgi:hypothetical protein